MGILATVRRPFSGLSLGEPLAWLVHHVAEVQGARRKRKAEFVFTAGVIALAAKMAKADGVVLQSEIDAFLEICDVPPGEAENVARLFNLAKQSVGGFEAYADQMRRYFGETPETLEHVLDGLFHIAKADGAIHADEVTYLRAVAESFGIDERFEALLARHARQDGDDPHAVLGTTPEMDRRALRDRYRRLVAENHPDRLMSRGVPESFVKLANDKLAAINAAYAQVVAEL